MEGGKGNGGRKEWKEGGREEWREGGKERARNCERREEKTKGGME